MLNVVKEKLTNLLLNSDTIEYTKGELKKVIDSIDAFEKANNTMTDMHSAFRALEEYTVQYGMEVNNYYQMDERALSDRITQIQKIVCLVTMASALISAVLRRYNTAKDTGTIAKYLRTLNDQKETFKNDKITWISVLKSLTTLVADATADKAIKEKELMLKIKEAS